MSVTAPRLSLHQLSLYNTGRMPAEQIIAAFAARRQQFERIVADIAAEKPKSRAQHHLIVGQRGMGKTMLLARIAAELRTDAKLSSRFIPLVFVEEQYAVDRLSKFWLNCLDSLADARELTGDNECVDEIDARVKRLTAAGVRAAKDDQPFADEVYEAFVQLAKVRGQRPVLLVDNLQLVFERLDAGQQHSLRELLMRPGSPILVGASPSPPKQSEDYGAAFYDHFKVHYLRPLDESEMRSLLVHLADVAQRDDVRQRVLQHPARLTVLRQLTGGNPRTVLTLFFLYAEDFAPTVFGDLEGLLDRVTPLYKARFEELTDQQQVVASAIANHWDPVTAATLVETTGLPASTISAQLDRLEKIGFVERTELFGETRIGYQLAERFFNIWFLMRSASRRQRREVEFLTRFLENFYEPADRSRLARHLMSEEHFSPDRYVWSRAVAASLTDRDDAEELTRHAELAALLEAREARARLHEVVDFGSLPPATLAFDDLRKKLMSLVPDDAGVTPDAFAKAVLGDRTMFKSGERNQLAGRSEKLNRAEIESVMESTAKARISDEQDYSREAIAWFSQRLASGQIRDWYNIDDWNRAFHQAGDTQVLRLMVDVLPYGLGGSLTAANAAKVLPCISPAENAPVRLWIRWGQALSKFGRSTEAEAAFREAIVRDTSDSWAWHSLALHFMDTARYGEAESAYREAISRNANHAWAYHRLGQLFRRLAHYDESEVAYREAIARDPKHKWAWDELAWLYTQLERYTEAETAFQEAIACDPHFVWSWSALGDLYWEQLDRFSDAAAAYEEALRIDPRYERVHHNRLFLRRDWMGEGKQAGPLMDELRALGVVSFSQTTHLHEALFAAYASNWGLATEALADALTLRIEDASPMTEDDWLRASAVLLHLNYGAELLAFLEERGDTARLRPWVEALRALRLGDRRALQNVAPEIRASAEILYDGIESLLNKLPEQTRRRPVTTVKRKRARRR